MKRILTLTLLLTVLLTACGAAATPTPAPVVPTKVPPTLTPTAVPSTATPEPQTLTVFAASSLTDAFTEISAAFEAANPGVTVQGLCAHRSKKARLLMYSHLPVGKKWTRL
jgi:ABC-type molybdate transport system substrate-binding protein